jgi:hypothetical protein
MEKFELKKEIIDSAVEYIDKVLFGIEDIIEDFQSGREDKATRAMTQLVDGIQWLFQAIDGTKDVQGNNSIDVSNTNPLLAQLIEAYENTDYVLLGDLLEYELTPVVKDWKDKLTLTQGVLKNASTL